MKMDLLLYHPCPLSLQDVDSKSAAAAPAGARCLCRSPQLRMQCRVLSQCCVFLSPIFLQDEDSNEALLFQLAHPLCLVTEVQMRPFRAFFQCEFRQCVAAGGRCCCCLSPLPWLRAQQVGACSDIPQQAGIIHTPWPPACRTRSC